MGLKKARDALILANVLLFVIVSLVSLFSSDTFALIRFGAFYGPLVDRGEWYRFFTANFLHYGILHIAFNMIALFALGRIVEEFYGTWRFLVFYLSSGVVGYLASYFFYYDSLSVGASGAIFGLVGVLFSAGFRKDIPWFMEKMTGTYVLPMIIVNVILGFIPGSHINNAAHIGGLITGMVFGYLFRAHPFDYSIRGLIFRFKSGWISKREFLSEVVWIFVSAVLVLLTVFSFVLLAVRR